MRSHASHCHTRPRKAGGRNDRLIGRTWARRRARRRDGRRDECKLGCGWRRTGPPGAAVPPVAQRPERVPAGASREDGRWMSPHGTSGRDGTALGRPGSEDWVRAPRAPGRGGNRPTRLEGTGHRDARSIDSRGEEPAAGEHPARGVAPGEGRGAAGVDTSATQQTVPRAGKAR